MGPTTSTCDKSAGSNDAENTTIDKSGVIIVDVPGSEDGLRLDADRIDTRSSKTIIWLTGRDDGIDLVVTDRTVTARSERAQNRLDAHRSDGAGDGDDARTGTRADDTVVMTDGGRQPEAEAVVVQCDYCTGYVSVRPAETDTENKCSQCRDAELAGEYGDEIMEIIESVGIESGDRVKFDGREWVFVELAADYYAVIVPVGRVARTGTARRVDVRDLTPVDDTDSESDPYDEYDPREHGRRLDDDDDGDSGKTVMTDGGMSIPPCVECGMDLVEQANLGTDTAGPREGDPGRTSVPAATCGHCGTSVGATCGIETVDDLMTVLGVPDDLDADDDAVGVVGDDDTVVIETMASERCSGSMYRHRSFLTVSTGDGVVLSGAMWRVTGVRSGTDSPGMSPQGDVEIDIESGAQSMTVTSGIWRCGGCERLTADYIPGSRCSLCDEDRRAERRDRRRSERAAEVRRALWAEPGGDLDEWSMIGLVDNPHGNSSPFAGNDGSEGGEE